MLTIGDTVHDGARLARRPFLRIGTAGLGSLAGLASLAGAPPLRTAAAATAQ